MTKIPIYQFNDDGNDETIDRADQQPERVILKDDSTEDETPPESLPTKRIALPQFVVADDDRMVPPFQHNISSDELLSPPFSPAVG